MTIKNIDPKTLKKWLDNNEAIIVDVREPAEHNAEKISGSNLIPLANICQSLLPQCNGKKLVVHCRSGKRSADACQKLISKNPSLEIYNLEGGIMAWSALGYEVKTSGKFFLPLDRQVQLTIGCGVLCGSIFGYLYDKKFFLLSGFFGAGLIFAALTGTCALAILLAKMPWNKASQKSTPCFTSQK